MNETAKIPATLSSILLMLFCLFNSITLVGQTNDLTGAPSLISVTSCTLPTSGNPTYTLDNATASSGVPAGCVTGGDGNHYDAWFSFSALSSSETVSIGNLGSKITNPEVQIFSGTTYANFVSKACGTTTATATGLTAGATYYIRVANVGANPTGTGQTPKFDICLTHPTPPPSNDDCGGAIVLTSGTANTGGTIWSATASSGIPAGCATGDPDDDVWYKITTGSTSNSLTVSLGSVGTNLSSSGAKIQVFTGSCGSLTSYACGTNSLTTTAASNVTYYIRVYSAGTGSLGGTSSGSAFNITATATGPTIVNSGRTNEVFQQTILSGSGAIDYPWEITYGPDNMLWITESRGYKVYRMDPSTGAKSPVLDLNSTSTDLSAWGADSLRAVNLTSTSNWNSSANNWPQGGLAGLAIHPKFGNGSGHDFVYISYVHRYLSTASGSAGIFFRNKIVRFVYNSSSGKLEAPAVVCDTIPGGQDHNSQRMIIAPVTAGGTFYLFYAAGDMGAGQYANRLRPQNAQNIDSYEGKILRFNLEPDGDGGVAVPGAWIPDDNPYNTLLGKESAVYSIGIRNNQGFAYDTLTNKLYGASHGPYSDDEINIIESFKNYGHPLIEGFADGNYNGNSSQGTTTSISAGAPYTDNLGVSSCPPIGNEATNKSTIDASGHGLYKEPLFSAYAVPLGDLSTPGTVAYIWRNNPGNAVPAPGWPTEAWSGLDLYSNKLIPGWKRSLVAASLKWGRLVRLKLDGTGNATAPANTVADTVTYFNSQNRFRDLAFSPDGKDIFVIMDNTSTTSGPGNANPVVPACAGCVQKYTFLGYDSDANGKSMISTSIDVTAGTANACQTGTTITIDNTNSNLWVPITGQDGNILAEIKANGNKLGVVTSSFYTNAGTVRETAAKKLYANRNITITPQTQPSSAVSIRLYLTAAEYNALRTATNSQGSPSGINAINDLIILKNTDACSPSFSSAPLTITPQYAEAFGSNYVLQANITSFSSFYFAGMNATTLPAQLLTFAGSLQNGDALLKWQTSSETNTSFFIVERSIDGSNYSAIGNVNAKGSSSVTTAYSFTDGNVISQSSAIIYYRLKIVDKNGQYSYSRVVSIVLNKNIDVFLFPNPVKQMLSVRLSMDANPVRIQVTDLTGRIVYSQRHLGSQNSVSIDVKQWKPQVYILKVINSKNEILTTRKFEKM
jgi:glucose/arabinose dehydrogenase